MSVVLSEHLPLLASAPEGIQKLRGLILELAVRGKLVPQDPNDEPASELIKRVALQRVQSVTGKARGKNELTPPVRPDEQPFSIPQSWNWIRLGSTVDVLDSLRKPVTKDARRPGPYPYYGASGIVDYVAEYLFDEDLVLVGEDGAKWGVGERTAFSITGKTWVNNHAHVLRPNRGLIHDSYLVNTLVARDLQPFITGTTVPKLNQAKLVSIEIPLPPLAEQQRIVAKVDELMAFCDGLEAEQGDAASAHARLVETLLGTLTHSTDATNLAANWQRLAEHFDTLFTTEASIDALKQTVLQLAVMGKLVPQESTCPNEVTCFEGDILPTGWRLESINEFCNVQGGIQKTPLRRPVKNHYPYLRVANVQRGCINTDELARYELTAEELVRWRLDAGDLLIVEGNGSESEIGRCAVWRGQVPDCVYQNHLIRVRPHVPEQVDYLQLFLNSPVGIGHMKRLAITTSGLFNLSVGKIRGIAVPLPPLAEQHRIVAKVDELMALCGRLKADLATARQHQTVLAETLIESALEAA